MKFKRGKQNLKLQFWITFLRGQSACNQPNSNDQYIVTWLYKFMVGISDVICLLYIFPFIE